MRSLENAPPLTYVPIPLPDNVYSAANETLFTSSNILTKLAIIDTCASNPQYLDRASKVFDGMRYDLLNPLPDTILSVDLHNKMVDAYFAQAERDIGHSTHWMDRGWDLYDEMAQGKAHARPDSHTFATALMMLMKYSAECERAGKAPEHVLKDITAVTKQKASLRDMLSSIFAADDPAEFAHSEPLFNFVRDAANRAGMQDIASELQTLKRDMSATPMEPVQPVQKEVVRLEDGVQISEGHIPYNIQHMRDTLQQVLNNRSQSDLEKRQLDMERTVYDFAKQRREFEARNLKDLKINTNLTKEPLQQWMWQWYKLLKDRLAEDIKDIKEREAVEGKKKNAKPDAVPLAPFLSCLTPDVLASITVMEVMSLPSSGGVEGGMKTTRALLDVGKAVEAEYQARILRRNGLSDKANNGPARTMSHQSLSSLLDRRAQREAIKSDADKRKKRPEVLLEWSAPIRLKVGAFLVDHLVKIAKVEASKTENGITHTQEQEAFYHCYEHMRGMKIGVIRLNRIVAEQLEHDPVTPLVHPRQLPMLVPPRPWLDPQDGGYLTGRAAAMRIRECQEQKAHLDEASREGHLQHVFDGLDVLGSTPWVVNKEVFEVALKVWNSGEEFAGLPPASKNLKAPERPVDYDTNLKTRTDYQHAIRELESQKRNNHSERCAVNYKMDIAHAFRDEVMFFPHNLDFRGRAYPIPPHLSHIGDDLSRGLLKFAERRRLGERGLRWLKIHLANVFGNDKISMDAREQFAMDHLEDIYDSAKNPLDGKKWWLKADDPWQCLATCMELRTALDSPNPIEYESNLPVHQDGTCNGLQHYAALGGDAVGAAQVNLDVADRPSDVYSFVARMVEEEIKKDIAQGHADLALISGRVSRKVVKQTVMTTVYGVTMVGARAQIERQLRDLGDIHHEKCWSLANYLARKTLTCIGDLFKGANGIQQWLSIAARTISRSVPEPRTHYCETGYSTPEQLEAAAKKAAAKKAASKSSDSTGVAKPLTKTSETERIRQEQMVSVIWSTPLGLPIVQPYRKTTRKQVKTNLQTVFISDPNQRSAVSPRKQASAFPPNFIHSLDATHMLLTAITMNKAGLAFASVHDSYWTHPSCVDEMSGIIRETFIKLHTENILEKLRGGFIERYGNFKVPVEDLLDEDIDRVLGQSDVPEEIKQGIVEATGQRGYKLRAQHVEDEYEGDLFVPRPLPLPKQAASAEGSGAAEGATVPPLRWVDLKYILPPLPERGDFDVSRTRQSQYFFS